MWTEGRDSLSSRQLGALALTAAGTPVFRLCCRARWPWALLGGLAAAGTLSALTAGINRRREKARAAAGSGLEGPKEAAAWQRAGAGALFSPLLLVAALLAAWESASSFPETEGNLLAAGLILGLALWAAALGPGAAGRCASLLLWITGLLHGIVLLGALPQLQWEALRPAGRPAEALAVWAGLLLPGAALWLAPALGEDQRLPHWPWWAAAGLGAAASVVTGGILTPALQPDPEAYRTLARGVSVLGVVRRFEALVNGAMLLNGFSLCALFLTALRLRRGPEEASKKIAKNGKNTKKTLDKSR